MAWRGSQADARARALALFDDAEAARWAASFTPEAEVAYRADLARVFPFAPGMRVLDAGAGAGAMCRVLTGLDGLAVTALEPVPAMLRALRADPRLAAVTGVLGFCDAPADAALFAPASFDVVLSRQVANGLFDPLAAFRNWRTWLAPGGAVVCIEGLFDRDAWTGPGAAEVDVLPLAAVRTTATVPYLLEAAGFTVEAVAPLPAVDAIAVAKVGRYMVVARA